MSGSTENGEVQAVDNDGSVRIAITAAIPGLLGNYGIEPEEILSEVGIPLETFKNPDNLISFRSRARLLELCAERTGCSHFGLLVGQQSGLSSFGLIGYLVRNTPDVESALQSLVRHFHLHAQGSLVQLSIENQQAFLGYGIYQAKVGVVEQLVDAAVAVAFNILCELCGPEFEATEASFTHRPSANKGPFGRFFKAPLKFDAERNGVSFPASWLKRPVYGADPELRRLLEKEVSRLEGSYSQDFSERVRQVVRTALVTGNISSSEVAAMFSIHTRTLHRRLENYGTSFRTLVDDCRYSVARELLEATDLGHGQIADMLAYSDVRSFTRAFRRWSGITPSEWRAMKEH